MAEPNGTGNGIIIGVEVLAERISNVSKRLDEQVTAQKSAVDAALVASNQAISAALATQEKAVNAAFLASEKALTAALSASEKAISKSEAAQSEVNKIIAGLQSDVISLRESRSQTSGKDATTSGDKQQANFNISLAISVLFNVITVGALVWQHLK
jgi:FKBP-type peptidyl-prolyl cis-trans isomerase